MEKHGEVSKKEEPNSQDASREPKRAASKRSQTGAWKWSQEDDFHKCQTILSPEFCLPPLTLQTFEPARGSPYQDCGLSVFTHTSLGVSLQAQKLRGAFQLSLLQARQD